MSTDAGASGAFGLLLSQYEQPEVKSIVDELAEYVWTARDEANEAWIARLNEIDLAIADLGNVGMTPPQ